MTIENTDYDEREGRARIEELPASDIRLAREDRDRPSPLRAPPGEPEDPEDAQRDAPPPRDPDDE